jgi:hypothetical protein
MDGPQTNEIFLACYCFRSDLSITTPLLDPFLARYYILNITFFIYIFTPIKNIILIYLILIQPLTLTDLNIINLVNFYIISLYLIFSLKITSTALDILSLFVVGDANLDQLLCSFFTRNTKMAFNFFK